MTHRSTLIQMIRASFAFYAAALRSRDAAGQAIQIADSRELFRKLLNQVFFYQLERADQGQASAADLLDAEHGIAVRITADNTLRMARAAADSFAHSRPSPQYHTLLVLILTDAPRFQARQALHYKDFDLQILTLADLLQVIETLPQNILETAAALLQDTVGASGPAIPAPPAPAPSEPIDRLPLPARQVLLLAALLPEYGLARTVFEHALDTPQRKAVPYLIEQHFLYESGGTLYLHTDMRTACADALRESAAECAPLLSPLWNYDRSWRWYRISMQGKHLTKQSLAHIFAAAADILPDEDARYTRQSAQLWKDTAQYTAALTQARRSLRILSAADADHWGVTRTYDFAGECHFRLGAYEEALQDWTTTLEHCANVIGASPSDLAAVHHNIGRVHIRLGEYDRARQQFLEELRLREAMRRSGKRAWPQPGLTETYESLDQVYSQLGDERSALRCRKNALCAPPEQADIWEALCARRGPAPYRLAMPPLPAPRHSYFLAWESALAELEQRLAASEKPIVVCGPDGIGKTTFITRFARSYRKGSVFFVRFTTSYSHTIASMAQWVQPPLPQDTDSCEPVLDILSQLGRRDILIIDDAELADPARDPTYAALMRMELRLILVTGDDSPSGVRLSAPDEQSLLPFFRTQDVNLAEAQIRSLIQAAGSHTATVDQLARSLAAARSSDTAAGLLRALDDQPPSADSSRTYEVLHAVFQASRLSETERSVLRFATLLPQGGMDRAYFSEALTDAQRGALQSLLDHGWLTQEHLLVIDPVIRRICRDELAPTDQNCRAFLDNLYGLYSAQDYDHEKYTQIAEVCTQAADCLEDSQAHWLNRSGRLWTALSQFAQVKEIYQRHLPGLTQRLQGKPALAEAYGFLGFAYGAQGSYPEALSYLRKALAAAEKNLHRGHPKLVPLHNEISSILCSMGQYKEALNAQRAALAILDAHPFSSQLDRAQNYTNAGNIHYAMGDREKTLEFMQEALALYEKNLTPGHPDLMQAYNNVALACNDLGRHAQALEFTLKALYMGQRWLPADHPDLAASYSNVGAMYSALGNYQQALEYHQKSLAIREKALSDNHPDLAASYSSAGLVYSDLGDYRKSLEYQLKALDILLSSPEPNHGELVRTYNNIGRVFLDLGDPRQAAVYMEMALDISKSTLKSDDPSLAAAYYSVGMACIRAESMDAGLRYLRAALDIYRKTLPDSHPQILQILRSLERFGGADFQ